MNKNQSYNWYVLNKVMNSFFNKQMNIINENKYFLFFKIQDKTTLKENMQIMDFHKPYLNGLSSFFDFKRCCEIILKEAV